MNKQIFTIDNKVDFFSIDDTVYICNEYSFNLVFSMHDHYKNLVNSCKDKLVASQLLENDNSFIEKCLE